MIKKKDDEFTFTVITATLKTAITVIKRNVRGVEEDKNMPFFVSAHFCRKLLSKILSKISYNLNRESCFLKKRQTISMLIRTNYLNESLF